MSVKQYEVTGPRLFTRSMPANPWTRLSPRRPPNSWNWGNDAVRGKMKMHLVRGKAAPEDEAIVWQGVLKIKEKGNLIIIVTTPSGWKISEGKLFKHYFRFPPRRRKAGIR